MFLLGAFKGRIVRQNMLISGFWMTTHGLFAAYAAFAVGWCMENYVNTAPSDVSAVRGEL